MRTLFGFGSGFGFGDAFLQFLLKDFAHEFLTGEEGIEAFDEKVANAGGRSGGVHKYVPVKVN